MNKMFIVYANHKRDIPIIEKFIVEQGYKPTINDIEGTLTVRGEESDMRYFQAYFSKIGYETVLK